MRNLCLRAGPQHEAELPDRLVDVAQVGLDVDVAAGDAERLARDDGLEVRVPEVDDGLDVVFLADGRVADHRTAVLGAGWDDGDGNERQRASSHRGQTRQADHGHHLTKAPEFCVARGDCCARVRWEGTCRCAPHVAT